MRLKLNQIKPNPFKKNINKGKLNEETIKKIQSSLSELGLMGAIPVFKKGKAYHSISHHHRIEALKRTYGKDYEVEVIEHNYNDEKALRGMVVENLTQRNDDFNENVENLKMIRNYLKKLSGRIPTRKSTGGRPKGSIEVGSTSHIAEWLNLQGEVMSLTNIKEHLSVADNLDKSLFNQVKKTHSGSADERTNGTTISKSQAILLAKIKDKEEQKALAKNILKSREERVREQSNLLSEYKKLKNDKVEVVKEAKNKQDYIDEGWEVVEEKDDGKVKLRRDKTDAEKLVHDNMIESIKEGKTDIADVKVGIVLPEHKKSSMEIINDNLIKLDDFDFDVFNKSLEKIGQKELDKTALSLTYHLKHLQETMIKIGELMREDKIEVYNIVDLGVKNDPM